ncbi:MAG: HAD-IA family hydrolase [Chloroflexi bacterium]|nr:HAD-IA family hydrolase [Chloroflexota bacterium]
MIKAVFFDFYNTLIRFEPPREELQVRACKEFGIDVDRKAIPRGYWVADDYMSRENARSPVFKRSKEDEPAFWSEYEYIILKTAGVEVPKELALRIFTRVRQLDRKLVLYEDVLPTLNQLKSKGIILGLISNLSRGLDGHCNELGLTGIVDFALTSSEIGVEKPHPPIFLAALSRARVDASESLHVGDQYYADVIGARGVGINPLLLDRDGFWAEIKDCPRIKSLIETVNHL